MRRRNSIDGGRGGSGGSVGLGKGWEREMRKMRYNYSTSEQGMALYCITYPSIARKKYCIKINSALLCRVGKH